MCLYDDKLATQQQYSAAHTVVEENGNAVTPLLTEDGVQQFTSWNATYRNYPHHMCIAELVTQQARITPHAIALVMDEHMLTYAELNRRANQVAHLLRSQGVGPEVLVGCCIERSPAMVVGLLGILKAGAAYLPLNPAEPAERLNLMLTDSGTSIVVTEHKLLPLLSSSWVHSICIEQDSEELARQSTSDVTSSITESTLAYVIYTSGSTGRPKGVEITHGSLLNLVYWHQERFAITARDRATGVSNPAFDATGWELWPYLAKGACISFPAEDIRVSPVRLRDWLISTGITVTFLPTPLAEYMLDLSWPASTALRLLLTGADTLHRYPAADLPFALINNYGPTEATVVTASGRVAAQGERTRPPAIGRPIANAQVYILDEELRPVPIGTPGELYIGGAGLARGYRNRPDLTREKFIPHPFDATASARLYKTGDLARYAPDGQIEFMGRIDRQVKIRGFRIEPGEIEAVLNRCPSVLQGVVAVQETLPEDKHLVVYIVMKEHYYLTDGKSLSYDHISQNAQMLEAKSVNVSQRSEIYDTRGRQVAGQHVEASIDEVRQFLSAHLPAYMVPAAFVVLDALPLTANGKVDRAALSSLTPSVDEIQAEAGEQAVEERVAEIVAGLLGLPQVGRDENIFLLGGNSFLVTQILAQIASVFTIRLPLRTLFNAPTVKQLSGEIEQRLVAQQSAR